jgi:hypothetical protein
MVKSGFQGRLFWKAGPSKKPKSAIAVESHREDVQVDKIEVVTATIVAIVAEIVTIALEVVADKTDINMI